MMMSAGETVIAIYDDFESANAVLQALLNEGFLQSDVGLAVSDSNGALHTLDFRLKYFEIRDDQEKGLGALLMSLASASYGLIPMDVPGIGPIVTAGPLAELLDSSTGKAMEGVTASLMHLGIPYYEAGYYAEALARDYALVTVHIRTEKATAIALDILRHNHPMTVKNRMGQWIGFDSPTELMAYDDVGEQHDAPYVNLEAVGRFPYIRLNLS